MQFQFAVIRGSQPPWNCKKSFFFNFFAETCSMVCGWSVPSVGGANTSIFLRKVIFCLRGRAAGGRRRRAAAEVEVGGQRGPETQIDFSNVDKRIAAKLKCIPGTLNTSQNTTNIADQPHMGFGFGPILTPPKMTSKFVSESEIHIRYDLNTHL